MKIEKLAKSAIAVAMSLMMAFGSACTIFSDMSSSSSSRPAGSSSSIGGGDSSSSIGGGDSSSSIGGGDSSSSIGGGDSSSSIGGGDSSSSIGGGDSSSSDEPVGELVKQKPAKQTWQYIDRYDETVLDAYTRPIWYTREVYDESALIVGKTGSTTLLYTPDTSYEVVIRDYHLNKTYKEGVDFTIEGNKITRIETGNLPYMEVSQYVGPNPVGAYGLPFDKNRKDTDLGDVSAYNYLAYYSDGQLLPYHINVSYRTNEAWDGYVPVSQTSATNKFINKLKTTNQGTVLFYGDSITFGCDASGHQSGGNAEPYLPRWSELVTQWLETEYDADIKYLNGAIGGWTTEHGVDFWNGDGTQKYTANNLPSVSSGWTEEYKQWFLANKPSINSSDPNGTFEYRLDSQLGQEGTYPAKYIQDNGDDCIDMLVLAFGMNDATNGAVGRDKYKQNIRTMINTYLSTNPNGAILLMSCMLPNTQSGWYTSATSWHEGVESALYEVASEYTAGNVCVAPITSMFASFEAQGKLTRNVLANNINHPNDFGVRTYAQTVLKTIAGDDYGVERYAVGTAPDTADGYVEKPLQESASILNPVASPKTGVTYRNITTVGTHNESNEGVVYLRFFDDAVSTKDGQYLEKVNGTSSLTDIDLQNFANQLIYNEKYVFSDYCQLIAQGTSTDGSDNYNIAFQRKDGGHAKRGDSITFPKGAIYEFDSNGDGTIDVAWKFADTFKVVYNPKPCAQVAGCTNGCYGEKWHVYETTEKYTYSIINVDAHAASTNSGITLLFWNDTIANNTVDFGYCVGTPGTGPWTAPDSDTMAFLQYIKVNGQSILSVYSNCALQGLDQYNGLHLSGLNLNAGDVISIDAGAVFRHNGKSTHMDYTFKLTWNGSTYVSSKV